MHLIVHLLALTSERVLPAVSNERGKSWGFPERLDDVSTYFTFVVGGERFGLPHFKTQKLLTLSAISRDVSAQGLQIVGCNNLQGYCQFGFNVSLILKSKTAKEVVSLLLMLWWQKWQNNFLPTSDICAISVGGLGQCLFQQLSFTQLQIFIKLPELLIGMKEENVLLTSVPPRLPCPRLAFNLAVSFTV